MTHNGKNRMCPATATSLRLAIGLVTVTLFLTGCSVNPATGERQLVLLSEAQEIAIGRQNDEQIVAEMGLYDDGGWQSYIQELGEELAASSERPDLPWTFRVIDDPVVNAFALPGGYIYVTRGILSHFNSEAELASVLGHEIGHVTGRHGVERLSTAQLATAGLGIAAVASEDFRPYAGLAQQSLQLLFLKFSRDDERQADDLGLRYMVRGDYDPRQMPKVFDTLDRVSAAHGGGRVPNWLATHPAPADRAVRISQQIEVLGPEERSGTIERNGYLRRLEGMTFGTDPRQGYAIDSTFYHPDLAFALDFPAGWQVVNQRSAVGAVSPEQDALVVLTLDSAADRQSAMQSFFEQQGIERGDAWRSFRYFRTAPQESSQRLVGLVGFMEHEGRLFRLLSYTADDHWSGYRSGFQKSLGSFRRLKERRYLDVEPQRLEVVQLQRAMTLEEFHRRNPSTVELEELAILNGVSTGERLDTGTWVKRVIGGELPDS